MAERLTKMIVVPVDGSENALRSLDYLALMFGPRHDLEATLLYIVPSLPSILIEDRSMDRQTALRLKAIENKNIRIAERILKEAKTALIQKGFEDERIKTVHRRKELSIARDICGWVEDRRADALLITTRGRSRLEAFFMGEISSKLVEYCRVCPGWILEGTVTSNRVLIAIDSSDNSLRAVDHAGFMLSGTDCEVMLFHTMRHLNRFVPLEALQDEPELQQLWKHKAGQHIAPYMKKAREMLLEAELSKEQIITKVVDGSRSAAGDILAEARGSGYGTIVVGRRGLSGMQEFFMGSVTSKILQDSAGLAVWVVQ
jgi:nucleotide-binding universal stress UspA family protein